MNLTADSSYGLAQRPSRLLAGVAVSLMLHAALLFAYRHSLLAADPSAQVPETRAIAVWLRPPAPATPPKPPPALEAGPTPPRTHKPRRAAPPRDVIAMPARPATPAPPEAFTVEPAEPAPPPRVDLDAARRLARQMASEPDPAKADGALGRLPQTPLASETRAARAIARAARPDCKDGIPGGLLAPLFLLMDKKDSGCKW